MQRNTGETTVILRYSRTTGDVIREAYELVDKDDDLPEAELLDYEPTDETQELP